MSEARTLVRHPDTGRLYTSDTLWRWPAYALSRGGRDAEFTLVPVELEKAWLDEFHVTELDAGDSVDRSGRVDHWPADHQLTRPPGGVTR